MATQRKITNPLSKTKQKTKQSVVVRLLLLIVVIVVFLFVHLFTAVISTNDTTSSTKLRKGNQAAANDDEPSSFDRTEQPKKHDGKQQLERLEEDREGFDEEDDDKVPSPNKVFLVLNNAVGTIEVDLRPDLSPSSVKYIQELIAASSEKCTNCRFYRAEKPGILQGKLGKASVPPNTELGNCPKGLTSPAKTDNCPKWDPNCGCHGPIMTRGMVGWAAGGPGPDFFIDLYKRKATWWETQHTVWGEVRDPDSLQKLDSLFELPVSTRGGMHYFEKAIHFELE